METALTTTEKKGILKFDLESELHHGMDVSNLAYEVAKELLSLRRCVMTWQLQVCFTTLES